TINDFLTCYVLPPLPVILVYVGFFFFHNSATTEFYTLSLHDALPILPRADQFICRSALSNRCAAHPSASATHNVLSTQDVICARSEEHTSELQSRENLVCRLLLEKNNTATKCRGMVSLNQVIKKIISL